MKPKFTNQDWAFLSSEEFRILPYEALNELEHHQEAEWYDTHMDLFGQEHVFELTEN